VSAGAGLVSPQALAARLASLEPIGLDAGGATTRLAWTEQDRAAAAWFAEQAASIGRRVRRDPTGSLWAVPDGEGPWWAAGSHLDSVRGGGRFDGALGVAAAFEAAARAEVPVAVIAFADEEGARFNTPTFGSRALAGRLDPAVLDRADADGVLLRDALRAFGVAPEGVVRDTPAWRARLRGFLELHIDQGTQVAGLGVPYAAASGLAARRRAVAEFGGQADHAGTASMTARRDALVTAAAWVVAVRERALARPGAVATVGRLLVEPNAPTTVPSRVRAWLDARHPDEAELDALVAELAALGPGVLEVQSRSDAVAFEAGVRAALGGPQVPSYAGHDAGLLAPLMPAGMVLVRNPTGISHAPAESVSLEDAALATDALVRALEALA
jgi:N-carbamoyl-L-amino-acid hydrolase